MRAGAGQVHSTLESHLGIACITIVSGSEARAIMQPDCACSLRCIESPQQVRKSVRGHELAPGSTPILSDR